MWLAALRRLGILLAATAAGTVALSLPVGLLVGYSVSRSIATGLYLVGSFLLIAGFFVGNRGPVRLKDDTAWFRNRSVRWASRGEQEESINSSAVFVTLGFLLIVLGVAADTRYGLI